MPAAASSGSQRSAQPPQMSMVTAIMPMSKMAELCGSMRSRINTGTSGSSGRMQPYQSLWRSA